MSIPLPKFARFFTARLAIATFLICFSVFNYGMDVTAFSTTQAMNPFIRRFGTWNGTSYVITPTNLSLLNSLPRIPMAAGIIIGGLIGERFGRRVVVGLMLVICIVGVIVSYTATNFAQILAGRMIVNMYIGMEGWLVPMFQAEIVPAQIRGVVVSSYVINHILGSFIMSIVTYKTSQFDTDMCWKIPIACMFIIPCIVLLMIWMIPESPRWLVRKDRDDEALKWLKWMYGENPEYAPEVELQLLREALNREAEKGTWLDLVRGTNLRRTILQIILQALNQLGGQQFAAQYSTVFVKSLNFINPYMYTIMSNGLLCVGPFLTLLLIDRLGRRNMYIVFGTFSCAALLTMAGLGLGNVNQAQKAGIVAMNTIFPLFYLMSFSGLAVVMGAEIPSLGLRDKSALIGWSVQNFCAFLVTFTVPYLLDDQYAGLHSKVGFIYGAICLLGLIWAYFELPELMGRSLEEIDEMFNERVPAKEFKTWKSNNPNSIGVRITDMEGHTAHANAPIHLGEEEIKNSAVHVETAD